MCARVGHCPADEAARAAQAVVLAATGGQRRARAAVVDGVRPLDALTAVDGRVVGFGAIDVQALIGVGARIADGGRIVSARRGGGRAAVVLRGRRNAAVDGGRLVGADDPLRNALGVGGVVVRARGPRAGVADQAQAGGGSAVGARRARGLDGQIVQAGSGGGRRSRRAGAGGDRQKQDRGCARVGSSQPPGRRLRRGQASGTRNCRRVLLPTARSTGHRDVLARDVAGSSPRPGPGSMVENSASTAVGATLSTMTLSRLIGPAG